MDKTKQYKKQRDYFDKEFASVTDYKLDEWQKSYIDRIKENVLGKNYKNKTLLDIATGRGYVAIEMARLGLNVTACDMSPEAIKNLEKYKKQFKLKNLNLIVCRAEELPLKDASVDFITANAILEHIPEESAAINEWKRVLKKNGRMYITVPLKFRHIWPFLWIPNMMHDKQIGHLRRYDLKVLTEKFSMKHVHHLYTGHLIKIVPILRSKFLRHKNIDDSFYEKKDRAKEHKRYGANNITVIFQK